MRVYDGKYLSVTSVLELKKPFNSSSFINWCRGQGLDSQLILNTSSILGDKVSEYLDNKMKGLESLTAPPLDTLEANLYQAVDSFLEKYDLIETERVVYCEQLHYAGRFDGIVKSRVNGEKLLVDWKTYGAWNGKPYKRVSSKIKSAKEQLTLYAYALNWKGELGVVVFKNDGTWELEKVVFDNEILGWVRNHQDIILEAIENENSRQS